MILSEIRNEIWEGLGRPTNLDPSSDTTYTDSGSTPGSMLTKYVNMGQNVIATWKDPRSGKKCKIRSLINEMYFRSHTISETVTDDIGNTTAPYYVEVDAGNLGTDDDRYNGWLLEDANNEVQIITDFDGDGGSNGSPKIYYASDFGTDPVEDDTVTLYKNFDFLLPSTHDYVGEHIQLPATDDVSLAGGNLLEVLSITDLETNYVLENASRADNKINFKTSSGDPRTWRRFGNKIEYDVSIDDVRWFKMEYYRTPLELTHTATNVPEIPEQYHYAIVLWGIMHGHFLNGEYAKEYNARTKFNDYMRSVVSQYDIAHLRDSGKSKLVYDWRDY